MIIKSLTLNNFRQFCGEQTIRFSTDANKKVTLVIAESGVGKTTLIQSFQWILYGITKYKSILNTDIKNALDPYGKTSIKCSMVIDHDGKEYTITRSQRFIKMQVKIEAVDSELVIDYKDDDGIDRQFRGRDANSFVKQLMHKDLFPYFFLEGESLTRVGEQMARGKSGANKEFVTAIKGLLGFNQLYEASKHLKMVVDDYSSEISRYTTNGKLKETIEKIKNIDGTIQADKDRISHIDTDISFYTEQRDEYGEKVATFKEVEQKQNKTKQLGQDLVSLSKRINDEKRVIFIKFSRQGIYPILDSLRNNAEATLKNADSLDKGIPGMDTTAIKYMLDHHRCVCGDEIKEGSKEWEALNQLITYLPPNNIGYEIKSFNEKLSSISNNSTQFINDFKHERSALNDLVNDYNSKADELRRLNEEISGVNEDIGALKQKEDEFNRKIVDLSVERKNKNTEIDNLTRTKSELQKLLEIYKQYDDKTQLLQSYQSKAEWLKKKIDRFCARKENEKRTALEDAINDIFSDFYTENIHFSLDSNYGVQITTSNKELSEDFTSGGQDVAVALAFIGAIIKVNGQKNPDPEQMEEDVDTEPYPLVLDAPVSNFGMKQMDSFSEIMPKIADQIIVFINDKDGPILKQKMGNEIGSNWSIYQKPGDSYHSYIAEAKNND